MIINADIKVIFFLWFGFFVACLPVVFGTKVLSVKGLLQISVICQFFALALSILSSYQGECEFVKVYFMQQRCSIPFLSRSSVLMSMHGLTALMLSLIVPALIRDVYIKVFRKHSAD